MKLLSKYKKDWIIIFLLLIIVLSIDVIAGKAGLYYTIDIFDDVMHFGGGLAIAIVYVLLLKIVQEEKVTGEMNPLISFMFVVSLVALTAVAWEFYEYLLDVFLPSEFLRQPSIKDTMGDLFLGLVGGSLGFLITKIKYLKRGFH